MSKRAEELAMDAYPGQMLTTCARGNKFAAGPLFRGAFIRGYELAEKYIKDALLEWAKEHYTGMDITKRDMWDGGYNCAMKQLIDKLNEM